MSYPFYQREMNLTQDSRIFLRKTAFEKFEIARKLALKQDFELIVYDGWRSVEVQENLFWHYLKEFTVNTFNLESKFQKAISPLEIKKIFLGLEKTLQEEMKQEHFKYVSWPSTDSECPSPHATGGSVDTWLTKNGKPVDFGVPFDWMDEKAGAFFHIENPDFFNDAVNKHRTLMIEVMSEAGFTCFPSEFWHFNYGNQMDSIVSEKTAIYSYIKP